MADEETDMGMEVDQDNVEVETTTGRWFDVTEECWAEIQALDDEQAEFDFVRSTSTIDAADDNERAMITLEFIFNTLHYCRETGAGVQQTQVFAKVAQAMFEQCIYTSKGADAVTADEAIEIFKERLRAELGGVEDKENVIPSAAVRGFVDFLTSSFFRHYTAYQLVFNEFQDVQVENLELNIQAPVVPGPLA